MTKLLSINNYYYRRGGAETVFFEHNRLLEGIGWTVVPFSMHHAKNLPCQWSEYFVEEIELGVDYSLREKLLKIPKVIYSLEAQRKIGILIDKIRPSIAHAHNIYHHISPSILTVLKQREIPVILTLHDLKLVCPAYTMLTHDGVCERCKDGAVYNVIRHRCINNSVMLSGIIYTEHLVNRIFDSYRRNVDRFVVPSRFYLDKMVDAGWDRKQFYYIPNFIDVNQYSPSFVPGKSFLYFGRLRRQKGLATLIRAAAMACVPLRIAGTGPEEPALRALSNQLGADVAFLGFLSGDALHNEIRQARATVLPSEWYENAPLSVMESYAFGKPVIGANIGGIPELIRNQETGHVFKSGDAADLARILCDYATTDDKRLMEMGQEGRNWIDQQFSVDRYRERILELYSEL
jgi:glycosyltransferase involved in cell wall biosynthesis